MITAQIWIPDIDRIPKIRIGISVVQRKFMNFFLRALCAARGYRAYYSATYGKRMPTWPKTQ